MLLSQPELRQAFSFMFVCLFACLQEIAISMNRDLLWNSEDRSLFS